MEGKLDWYQSVVEVDLTGCEEDAGSGVLAELGSMPSLRSLMLPASYAESAVDAEAVCGLTTLTTLRFDEMRLKYDEDGELVEVGEWVLDLSRLPTLTSPQARWLLRRDGQGGAGAEQRDGPHRPQPMRLRERHERGTARSDKVVTECWKG